MSLAGKAPVRYGMRGMYKMGLGAFQVCVFYSQLAFSVTFWLIPLPHRIGYSSPCYGWQRKAKNLSTGRDRGEHVCKQIQRRDRLGARWTRAPSGVVASRLAHSSAEYAKQPAGGDHSEALPTSSIVGRKVVVEWRRGVESRLYVGTVYNCP